MDNASNALIMAAEILIAILVLSLIVTVNVLFGSYSRSVNDQIAESKDAAFNSHFYNYLNRANISAAEVASIINFSKITNDENGYKRINPSNIDENAHAPYYINVYINDVSFFYGDGQTDNFYDDFIKLDDEYISAPLFKDKVNTFINNKKQEAFCCNVSKITMPPEDAEPDERIVKLECYGDSNQTEVSIVDPKHPDAKNDGNIRVVRICFFTIDRKINPMDTPYNITTSNEYTYEIQ